MSEYFRVFLKAQRTPLDGDSSAASNGTNGNGAHAGRAAARQPVVRSDEKSAGFGKGRLDWLLPWTTKGEPRNGHGQPAQFLATTDGSMIGEQFRVLRSRLEALGPGAFMITSAVAQEGKTLCAINLTLALSLRIDAGVILIDADLRRPSAGGAFGVKRGPGLADCLMGEAQWRDCLASTPYDNLRVLPAGRRTAKAPELLSADCMQTLVGELKAEFPRHYILFDTPPVLLTADPMVTARHMDHVLLVVRAGRTPRASVLKAIKALGPDRLLGIVLNDTTDNVSEYYYYGAPQRYYVDDPS